jgi:hypothetical protein
MENNNKTEMVQVASQGGKYRWVAIAALLLAIGSIMRIVSPSFAGVSPNWIITMYCVTILIIRPNVPKAVAIGLVAGAINTFTSKSPLPHIGLLSEPIGALVCVLLMTLPFAFKVGPVSFRPAVIALITTLASGFTFITTFKLIMNVPMQVYLYGMMPVVLFTAAANTVLTQILYYPAQKLLGNEEKE